MKELSIEQKAKAYDEAVERAKYYQKENGSAVISAIFPELAKSEDERIRKAIIKMIADIAGGFPFEKYGILKKEALAWLEKQGEQNLANSAKTCKDEQKPAEWSEDDQSNFNELGSFILETYRAEDASELLIWLNSIKDRVQPQPKQEWSEEDEEIRNFVTNIFKDSQRNGVSETIMPEQFNKIFAWLESLKDRFKCGK